jgi:hypothetical protein
MTDETPTVAPSNRPDPQSLGNTVAILLGVPPCLPDIDHHCIP